MRLEIERMEEDTNKRRKLLLMGDEEEDDILAQMKTKMEQREVRLKEEKLV